MLKKILCLIAFTLVLSVFDATAMGSVDHESIPKEQINKYESTKLDQKLIDRQIESILKKKKSRNSLKSNEEMQAPKVSRI